jgi:hypothetical protein
MLNEKPTPSLYEMQTFEAAMQLRDLKVGDVVTETNMKALNFFVGDILKAARLLELKSASITFKDGKPVIDDPNGLIGSVKMPDEDE